MTPQEETSTTPSEALSTERLQSYVTVSGGVIEILEKALEAFETDKEPGLMNRVAEAHGYDQQGEAYICAVQAAASGATNAFIDGMIIGKVPEKLEAIKTGLITAAAHVREVLASDKAELARRASATDAPAPDTQN